MLGLNHTLTLITAHRPVCGEACQCPFLSLISYIKSSDQDQWQENNWRDGMCKGDVRGITHLLTTACYPLGKQPKETDAFNMRDIIVILVISDKGQFPQIMK